MLFYPLFGILVIGLLMYFVINAPFAFLNNTISNGLNSNVELTYYNDEAIFDTGENVNVKMKLNGSDWYVLFGGLVQDIEVYPPNIYIHQ